MLQWIREDEHSAHIPREDSGKGERIRNDHRHDFGSCQVGVCRAMDENTLGISPLGVECAGADVISLDMKDVYHSRNQNRKKLISLKFILHSQDCFQGPTTSTTLSAPAHFEKMAESL